MYVGKVGPAEVDFVVTTPDGPAYIQVAATVSDPAVLERELAPLRSVPGHYRRILLTADTGTWDHDGIRQDCVYDWLLDDTGT